MLLHRKFATCSDRPADDTLCSCAGMRRISSTPEMSVLVTSAGQVLHKPPVTVLVNSTFALACHDTVARMTAGLPLQVAIVR